MENLINKILEDIKNNLKIFIITFAIFISVFYAEDQMTKKTTFSYTSSMVMTRPDAISDWVSFNQGQFIQDLYHYLINTETSEKINNICNLNETKKIIDMNFTRNGFIYIKFVILHNNKLKFNCMNEIYNSIISTYFNDYITKIIQDNKIQLQSMKNENLSVNSNLFLSTFRDSYRAPQLIEMSNDIRTRSDNANHTKIIVISFIFSVLLTLFLSTFSNKYKRKKKRG